MCRRQLSRLCVPVNTRHRYKICLVILIGYPRKKPVRLSPKVSLLKLLTRFLQNDKETFLLNLTAMVSPLATDAKQPKYFLHHKLQIIIRINQSGFMYWIIVGES